jgi:hypothetical protein
MKEILENIGLIVASVTAIYGINTWRRELRGRKQYEIAEEALSLFYNCRDRIREIRNPFAGNEEGSTRKTGTNESPEETKFLNNAYVVYERYFKHQELFARLSTIRYRFAALFGREKLKPFEDFIRALNEVFHAAQTLPSYWMRQGRVKMSDKEFERHLKEMGKNESIFWGIGGEKDEFDVKIERIILEVENICAPILMPPPWTDRLEKFYLIIKDNFRK